MLGSHKILNFTLTSDNDQILIDSVYEEGKKERKKELVALLLLTFGCLVTVDVLWLFLTVP